MTRQDLPTNYKSFFIDLDGIIYEIKAIPNTITQTKLKALINQLYRKTKFWQSELGIKLSKIEVKFLNYETKRIRIDLQTVNPNQQVFRLTEQLNSWDQLTSLPTFNFETNLLRLKQVLKTNQCDLTIKYQLNDIGTYDEYFVFQSAKFNEVIAWNYFNFTWEDLNSEPIVFNHHYLWAFVNNFALYQNLWKTTTIQIISALENKNNGFNSLIVPVDWKTIDPDFSTKKIYYRINQQEKIAQRRGDWLDVTKTKSMYQPLNFDIYAQLTLTQAKLKCNFVIGKIRWSVAEQRYTWMLQIWVDKIENLIKQLVKFDQSQILNYNHQNHSLLISWFNNQDTIVENYQRFNDLFLAIVDQNQTIVKKVLIKDNDAISALKHLLISQSKTNQAKQNKRL